MKRYKSYLESVQENETNKILKLLKDDCSEFIKELKLNNINKEIFFRGFQENIKDIKKIDRRKNRSPKDTSLKIHNDIDIKLFNIFGWKPRSEGVFTTIGYLFAKAYNDQLSKQEIQQNPYIFFPIDSYSFIFNKDIKDIYDTYDNENLDIEFDEETYRDMYYYGELTDEEVEELRLEKTKEIEERKNEIIEGYQDNILEDSYNKNVEVIFNCDNYYLINYKYLENIKKFIYDE